MADRSVLSFRHADLCARWAGLLSIAVALAGCAGAASDGPLAGLSGSKVVPPAAQTAEVDPQATKAELSKATEYWGKEYAKKPQDLDTALAYAKNLKAMGQKGPALGVLQQVSVYHAGNRKLAAEYGRLALELDQLSVANQMLELGDDPASPDWRIVSARGTVLAKMGRYKDSIAFFERAQTLAANQPSVLNNLALAYAMNGDAAKAEVLLRQVAEIDAGNVKARQNLALVLGLQGKYDEATKIGSQDLPRDSAVSNTALVRQIVKLEPKVMPQGVIAAPPVQVATPAPGGAPQGLKPTMAVSDAAATDAWATKVAATGAGGPAAPAPASWATSAD